MSIYFVQVLTALLGFSLFAALNNNTKHFSPIFLPSLFGIIAGILIFKMLRYALLDTQAKAMIDCITLVFLLFALIFIFINNKYIKMAIFALLGLGYGFTYSSISSLFPLFNGELLDTQSVISFFLMCFAMLLCIFTFFIVSNLKEYIKANLIKILAFIVLFALFFEKISVSILELMRLGKIPTHTQVLSLVAKGIYISSFLVYFFVFIIFMIVILASYAKPNLPDKKVVGSVPYRFALAKRNFITTNSKFVSSFCVIAIIFALYYDLYASKPPQISTPTLVEPQNGKFVFDTEILKDNDLHRYAYITDDGKEVRFFLLNRFPDRPSPIIVFDSCMICGDMGYVKKSADLICISCNVRIFLPSVGKEGGCNPIPMKYKFDGRYITVDYQTIVDGSNYFSKVVEKIVLDPVSRKKVSNLTSPSYLYYNRRYFFENNKTQAEFEANPEKYVDINGTLK
ncbi:MAG: Fe-S-containing protein [Campylobacter sp.]|nr:Fe-S-containing protein [Campylobacter sp.]